MDKKKEEILDAYYFRHACKRFDETRTIGEEDFSLILETGRLSPSSFGFEPWRFLVVQSPALREKLKAVSWGAVEKLETASHFVVILARVGKDMIYNSEYVMKMMKEVQQLPDDIVTMKKAMYENFQTQGFKLLESDRAIFDWACKQTYIPLANMMTTAAFLGIDSCPIEGFDRDAVEKILKEEGVLDPEHYGLSCMVAFGYRKTDPREKTRQELRDIVEWV